MKTKMKRFLSWNPHHSDGFTLVELIVVIAILAILAAVAIPAYSGYIEKSRRAGDEILLSAVNKAFASACLLNGHDVTEVIASDLDMEEGCVIGIESITLIGDASTFAMRSADPGVELDDDVVAKYEESFLEFFGDNKNTKFQVIKSLAFDALTHQFVDPETDEVVELQYAGGILKLSAAALKALKGSSFLNGAVLNSTQDLLDQVAIVTDIAKGMAFTKLEAVFEDGRFHDVAKAALGAATQDEYDAIIAGLKADVMDKYKMTEDEADAHVKANAAVLYASKYAVSYTDEQITNLFTNISGSDVANNLRGKNGGDTAEGMAQATLIYGMYVAYANSKGEDEFLENASSPSSVIAEFDNNDEFRAYYQSEQGQKDLQAYLSTLTMINDAADTNPNAVADLMINGFNNADLVAALSGQLGK